MTDEKKTLDSAPTQDVNPDPDKASGRVEATDTRPPEEKEEPAEPAHKNTRSKFSFETPPPRLSSRIQRGLALHGFYESAADSDFGHESLKGVQRALEVVGYHGAINGRIGETQAELIQQFAAEHGGYAGERDKNIDENTWAAFAVGLENL